MTPEELNALLIDKSLSNTDLVRATGMSLEDVREARIIALKHTRQHKPLSNEPKHRPRKEFWHLDITLLKDLTLSAKDIADMTGFPASYITRQRYMRGIIERKYHAHMWSDDEYALLALDVSAKTLSTFLDRTENAIRNKRNQRNIPNRNYDDKNALRLLWAIENPAIDAEHIAKKLDISVDFVLERRIRAKEKLKN